MSMPKGPPGAGPKSAAALFLPTQYAGAACPPSRTPRAVASSNSNGGTTEPAANSSIFSRPPDSLPTRSAKNLELSQSVLADGQAAWILSVFVPCPWLGRTARARTMDRATTLRAAWRGEGGTRNPPLFFGGGGG